MAAEEPPPCYVAPRLRAGLGNRLFTFAAAAGAAERWGLPLRFLGLNEIWENEHGDGRRILAMYPHVIYISQDPRPYISHEEGAHQLYVYHPFPVEPLTQSSSIIISGYRQNPGYFPRDLSVLQPDWTNALGQEGSSKIARAAGLQDPAEQARTAFIHFRRGDYDTLDHHQVNLVPYYLRAVSGLPEGTRLHCFSDEPEKCSDIIELIHGLERSLEITWSTQTGDVEALYEMSLCRAGGIAANSTFSWWGAFFSHQAGGVGPYFFPSQWGKGLPDASGTVPEWGTSITVRL